MRSRFGGALGPLTRGEVTYFAKESRELVSLNYAEPLSSPLWSVRGDALGHLGYFAELIDECALEGDADERLYRLGRSVIDALAAGAPVEALARYFEYWLLRLQGVYPSPDACQRCGTPFDDEGAWLARPAFVLLCGRCGGTDGPADLSRASLGFLRRVGRVPPERLGEVELGTVPNRELERVHRALIAAHLERELRSVRVLREWMPEP